MILRGPLPPDVELIWDPTPDDDGVKRGDSFCFLKIEPDGRKILWKEYPYDPSIIQRYHILQNTLARELCIQNLCIKIGKRVQVLLLPEEIAFFGQQEHFLSSHNGCRVEIPYIGGEKYPYDEYMTMRLQNVLPEMMLQKIQPTNCRETAENIIITDIAWDIPGFLRNNPSENTALNILIERTYTEWSKRMYQIYPFLGKG